MDLRQLKYFIAVFEHHNLSRAAAEIPISQPALTRSVKLLESELGVKLFRRQARGVIPTSAGERFYRHANKILAACERAEKDVRTAGDFLSGEITIGVTALFAESVMERVVAEFLERHPRVKITVRQSLLGELLLGLERGELELALCNFPIQPVPETHTFETLVELNSYAYASSDHPLADGRKLTWKCMAEASWVNFNQSHSRETLDAIFLSLNLAPPRPPLLTDSLTLLKAVIQRRGFIGMLPEQLMASEVAAGSVIRLSLPGTPIIRNGGLIMLKESNRSPLTELFAEELRVVCQEMSIVQPVAK
jgi:LysR family transcriptional regulator of gallate degradation